jgi:Ni/Fe-hydrogenase subunit HybB-like protein
LTYGLGITGRSSIVSWGIMIGQFTFLVGVAASTVMVVLPYYLHNYKVFGKITLLGEFLALASVTTCLAFMVADLGQPSRVFNVLLHLRPNSILFWDMVMLIGHLFLNIAVACTVLIAERKSAPPPNWAKPLIYFSILWAVSILIVQAFLYAGLPGRGLWLTAIMVPRFLGSALVSGTALLILLCMFLRKCTKFAPGWGGIQTLAKIVTYAMIISVFFVLWELLTAFYSRIPDHANHYRDISSGVHGHDALVSWMWGSTILAFVAVGLLIHPKARNNKTILPIACAAAFVSVWLEKGIFLLAGYGP